MIKLGDKLKKVGGDYCFYGTVVGIINKLSGQQRYVLENKDGMLFIFSQSQLEDWDGAFSSLLVNVS